MSAQEKGTPEADRKRKRKFTERELQILIEEVHKEHDKLFGKSSMQVPEGHKRKIWLRIQELINAIGVTSRSIDDLKKRWYDLRKVAKERVSERRKHAAKSGAGVSTVPAPTALDLLVESTLQPETISGIGNVDSSATTSRKQGKMHPLHADSPPQFT